MNLICEDRGEDLVAAAQPGADPSPELLAHFDACPVCSEEWRSLTGILLALDREDAAIAPSPQVRARLMRDIGAEQTPVPLPPVRPRSLGSRLAPVVLLSGSLAAGLFLAVRSGSLPGEDRGDGAGDGVTVTALHGSLIASTPSPGRVLRTEGSIAVLRLGAPVAAEVVLDRNTSVRIEGEGTAARLLHLERGRAWFAPDAGEVPLEVRVGSAFVLSRGATFSLELATDDVGGHVADAIVAAGTVEVRGDGVRGSLTGPVRASIDRSAIGEPVPVEAPDASSWFLHPVATLREDKEHDGRTVWVMTLRPSLPRVIPMAPWNPFEPMFTLRATNAVGALRTLDIERTDLARPAPEGGTRGAFLLGPERPYILRVDPEGLNLPPGTYGVEAVYTSTRPGGLWRGVVASPPVDLTVK
jgi:hypothetical protein